MTKENAIAEVVTAMPSQEFPVEVQPDFIERQTKAQPLQALSELIWNALDADSTEVNVEFNTNVLGGFDKIVISDNGHGIPHSDAPALFKNLGGSWKKHALKTKGKGRMLHGQEGRGRFKAFALGSVVDWKIVYQKSGVYMRYDIAILERFIKKVLVSDEEAFAAPSSGVTVVISELKRQFVSLLPEHSVQELSEIFAIYLKNYRDAVINIAGVKVDPSTAIEQTWPIDLAPIVDDTGKAFPASLEVIAWRRQTKRALYLCNEEGFPLGQADTRFHVGDFQFSAYLKSSLITKLQRENQLELADMIPHLQKSIDEAREEIKKLFRERAAERARLVVDDWKEKKLYPYEGEASSPIEKAERQIFDIVAVTVQEATPDYKEAPRPQLALHLRMLKHAIERSPSELQKILDEVLKLPKRTQSQLATLLEESSLSGIISAASVVADRLKFIKGLETILFDPQMKKRLKERTQLHKILETNTWIFGEEYNLWASDRSLTEVLKQHSKHLDPSIIIDDPVKHVSQERGIVDLMLSRILEKHRPDDVEHLVVELKAPKVILKGAELTQIEGYAASVAEDPRFRTVPGLRWHFWLVSDEYNKEVEYRLKGHPEGRYGIVSSPDNMKIGVKTWAQVIRENKARLQFYQEKLDHTIDESGALAALQEKHKKFLEGVIIESTSDEENAEEQTEGNTTEALAEAGE